jgi:glycosyltransferase involved in cell wall biosynthesis
MDEFLLLLADGITCRGWKPMFIFSGEPAPCFQQELKQRNAGYFVMTFPFSCSSVVYLARLLRRCRPVIMQTSFISFFSAPLLLLRLLRLSERLVVIDHSSGTTSPKRGICSLLAKLRGWIVGHLIDRVVPVSEAIARRDVQQSFLPAAKVRRIYNGVSMQRFEHVPPHAPNSIPRVVYAGQLIPEKGVHTLLRALPQILSCNKLDLEVLIAGEGHQKPALQEYCNKTDLHQVKFLGHVSGVTELFSSADVVVIPSEWAEACALVTLEAMACRAAIVTSDAGGLPEQIGDAGLVFRTGDVDDLAAKIRALLDSPSLRTDLGSRARQRVERMFTLDRCVEEHLAVLDEVSMQLQGR